MHNKQSNEQSWSNTWSPIERWEEKKMFGLFLIDWPRNENKNLHSRTNEKEGRGWRKKLQWLLIRIPSTKKMSFSLSLSTSVHTCAFTQRRCKADQILFTSHPPVALLLIHFARSSFIADLIKDCSVDIHFHFRFFSFVIQMWRRTTVTLMDMAWQLFPLTTNHRRWEKNKILYWLIILLVNWKRFGISIRIHLKLCKSTTVIISRIPRRYEHRHRRQQQQRRQRRHTNRWQMKNNVVLPWTRKK